MREEGMSLIDIILAFSISDDVKFQHSAYHALKDYIFLIHDNDCCDTKIAEDMIQAFIIGSLSSSNHTQEECAAAISYIVTHRLVYKSYFDNTRVSE